MTQETEQLTTGRYLLRDKSTGSITEVNIIEISETSVKLRFTNGYEGWKTKRIFRLYCSAIEVKLICLVEIYFMRNIQTHTFKTELFKQMIVDKVLSLLSFLSD